VNTLAVIITYPTKPLSLLETVADRTATAVGLTWLEGTDNGGSTVFDYEVSHAKLPAGTYTVEKQNNLGITFVDSGLTSGSSYLFRVRSQNSFGYSDYSEELELLVAYVPKLPVPPTTSVVANNVILTWVAPDDNGSPINKYVITIRKSDNTYFESEFCNGQLNEIMTALKCTIPLASLTGEKYNLVQGNSVNAKVVAHNHYGPSD
jgi:Fibronectin type III domain